MTAPRPTQAEIASVVKHLRFDAQAAHYLANVHSDGRYDHEADALAFDRVADYLEELENE